MAGESSFTGYEPEQYGLPGVPPPEAPPQQGENAPSKPPKPVTSSENLTPDQRGFTPPPDSEPVEYAWKKPEGITPDGTNPAYTGAVDKTKPTIYQDKNGVQYYTPNSSMWDIGFKTSGEYALALLRGYGEGRAWEASLPPYISIDTPTGDKKHITRAEAEKLSGLSEEAQFDELKSMGIYPKDYQYVEGKGILNGKDFEFLSTHVALPNGGYIAKDELAKIVQNNPKFVGILKTQGNEAYNKAINDYNNKISIKQQMTDAEYSRFMAENTRLPDGQYMNKNELARIQASNKAAYDTLINQGFSEYDKAIKRAESTLTDFRNKDGTFNIAEALLTRKSENVKAVSLLFNDDTVSKIKKENMPGLTIGLNPAKPIKGSTSQNNGLTNWFDSAVSHISPIIEGVKEFVKYGENIDIEDARQIYEDTLKKAEKDNPELARNPPSLVITKIDDKSKEGGYYQKEDNTIHIDYTENGWLGSNLRGVFGHELGHAQLTKDYYGQETERAQFINDIYEELKATYYTQKEYPNAKYFDKSIKILENGADSGLSGWQYGKAPTAGTPFTLFVGLDNEEFNKLREEAKTVTGYKGYEPPKTSSLIRPAPPYTPEGRIAIASLTEKKQPEISSVSDTVTNPVETKPRLGFQEQADALAQKYHIPKQVMGAAAVMTGPALIEPSPFGEAAIVTLVAIGIVIGSVGAWKAGRTLKDITEFSEIPVGLRDAINKGIPGFEPAPEELTKGIYSPYPVAKPVEPIPGFSPLPSELQAKAGLTETFPVLTPEERELFGLNGIHIDNRYPDRATVEIDIGSRKVRILKDPGQMDEATRRQTGQLLKEDVIMISAAAESARQDIKKQVAELPISRQQSEQLLQKIDMGKAVAVNNPAVARSIRIYVQRIEERQQAVRSYEAMARADQYIKERESQMEWRPAAVGEKAFTKAQIRANNKYHAAFWGKIQAQIKAAQEAKGLSKGLSIVRTIQITRTAIHEYESVYTKALLDNMSATQALNKAKAAAQESIREQLKSAVQTQAKAQEATQVKEATQSKVQAQTKAKEATQTKTAVKEATKEATQEATKAAEATKEAELTRTAELARTAEMTRTAEMARSEEITTPRQPPPPKPPLPSGASDKEKQAFINQADGMIARKRGELHGRGVYHVEYYPYGSKDILTYVGNPPKGVVNATGKGSMQKSIITRGRMPKKTIFENTGAVDDLIIPSGKTVRIKSIRDTSVIRRIKPPRPSRASANTGLKSFKHGRVYHTPTRGGTLLSRRPLGRRVR